MISPLSEFKQTLIGVIFNLGTCLTALFYLNDDF